jgi:hypothetical protein
MASSVCGVLLVSSIALVGVVGCAGQQGGGSESTSEVGLALVDGDARAAGFALSTDHGRRAATLPIEIDEHTSLVGPGQKIPLDLAPGELLLVRGSKGEMVPFSIGTEIEASRVLVEGSEQGARALARKLDATVEGTGPYVVAGPDLLARLAHVEAPEGVRSITPLEITGAVESDEVASARQTRLDQARRAGEDNANHEIDFTSADPRFARFGLTGEHAPSCLDSAAGTWVSAPTYYPAYNDWYTVTLHVARGEGGAVRGAIDVQTWAGDAEQHERPSCGEAAFDSAVNQSAVGEVSDSKLRLTATNWSLGEQSCTRLPGAYNIDEYTGVFDGSILRTVNNDKGRAVDDPVGFERVSCK